VVSSKKQNLASLNIVLYQPEIAENVGNIMRTCVAFNAVLHLIRPYGFFFNKFDPRIKRASANHLNGLQIYEYDTYASFVRTNQVNDQQIYFLTRYGTKQPRKISLIKPQQIYFVFGKESTGIPLAILKKHRAHTIRIPSSINLRSLNLANTVAMMCYEFACQNQYRGLAIKEPHKRLKI
jgi:tRNA (cytidine/uridine-2'-O-)-methyltransferase